MTKRVRAHSLEGGAGGGGDVEVLEAAEERSWWVRGCERTLCVHRNHKAYQGGDWGAGKGLWKWGKREVISVEKKVFLLK